jgi:hypothetical protein
MPIVRIALLFVAFLLARAAWAQDLAVVVPVAQAAFHVPVMQNDVVTVLNVYIPPNRASGYHRHERDSVGVLLADAERTGQNHGDSKILTAARRARGSTSFTFYSKQPNAHNVTTIGSTAFHNMVIELRQPMPAGNTAGSREGSTGYTQIMDNARVRGWRLVLEPGQSVPAITQGAPGIRVVIDGGEIVESVPGQPERGMAPKYGEFYWHEAGVTRAVRNNGMSRIEFVEFEFK